MSRARSSSAAPSVPIPMIIAVIPPRRSSLRCLSSLRLDPVTPIDAILLRMPVAQFAPHVAHYFFLALGMKLVAHPPQRHADHVAVVQLRSRAHATQLEPQLVRQRDVLAAHKAWNRDVPAGDALLARVVRRRARMVRD